ncbi:hypothetical protein LMG32879_000344 [Brytella acorum]|uniref:Uncharacterized protein n=2 Tax=Brytella acorum TaxID=2959299 RepID=A0AA35ULB0_9PROT|nr:hypothetical protein LMG32879_000344 [Brytella acorum]
MSVAGVGSVDRSLSAHFLDHISSADYGTVGNNTTDDGPAFASAVAAAAQSSLQVPHSSAGYLLNTGSFSGGEYPNYSYNWQTDASVYPGVSDIDYGNSYIHGTAAGSPDNCTGNINSPYTQPCLAVTGRRIIMDPASIWAGPNTTNVGLDIECLPNHVSPNSANLSNGYARNWTACMYFGAETGTGGTTNTSGSGFGSSISTELVNWALNVNTNSGIGEEFDINVIGNVLDGGITRGQFMLSSAAFKGADSVLAGHSPWGTAGSWAEGYEVNATPFTTTTKPATQTSGNGETVYTSSTSGSTTTYTVYPRWTRGYSASGAVDDFVGVTNVAGESGNLLRGMDATGANYFALDKLGNVTTNGFVYVKNANFYVSNGRYCLDTACARYIYEAGSRVKIGNTTNGDVFSIDDSGNVIAKGTITPSATP